MGPTFLENKCTLIFFAALFCLFLFLDSYLLLLIKSSSGPPPLRFNTSSHPCTALNPYCTIDVKSLLLDWLNFYIYNPLSALLYKEAHFSTVFYFVSANSISIFHVFLAAAAGRLIAHDSLCIRRLGVCVFELRNFLDAFDGTVARARRGGPNSDNLNSLGYYVDGICDGLGCLFLLLGCWVYLKNHPVKKKSLLFYSPLPTMILPSWTDQKEKSEASGNGGLLSSSSSSPSTSICLPRMVFSITNKACRSSQLPIWMGIQWFISSSAWNRYISRFTYILEKQSVTVDRVQMMRQGEFLRETMTLVTLMFWRLINVHATVELVLLSIFFDRLGSWGELLLNLGWMSILLGVIMGEILLQEAQNLLL